MIIWINGAFGSGKTQTAFELHRRVSDSYIYDPENAGFFIRNNIPRSISKGDFQDYPEWREINYTMLSWLNREYAGPIIVPMTIVNPQYFAEIVGRLRDDGATVHHFALCASKEVLLKRLRSRGDGRHSWAAQQIERCRAGLADRVFAEHMDTDNHSIEDNVAYIASQANLTLTPDHRGKLRKSFDRLITKVKQMHLLK